MAGMPQEILIETPEALQQACEQIAVHDVIGFDTEFIGEGTYVPDLCLIQVATSDRLYLIDPFAVGPLDMFWSLLADSSRVVVVHAGREEIRLFHRATGKAPENFFDLQIAAGLVGLDYPLSHASLVRELLKTRLHKGETLTNWRKRPLTRQQVAYAFDDVRYLLQLWGIVAERLAMLDRISWEREEVGLLIRRSLGQEPVMERWRRLRIGGLDRKKLAIVKALFEWRERKALERNRPVRTVLRDDLIIEIARRFSRASHDLEMIRGISKRDVSELSTVVAQAMAQPPSQWPPLPERGDEEPNLAMVAGLVQIVLNDLCARLGVWSKLAASAADIRQLVRSTAGGQPIPADSPFASGWRAQALTPELMPLLSGKRWLRVASLCQANPLEYRE